MKNTPWIAAGILLLILLIWPSQHQEHTTFTKVVERPDSALLTINKTSPKIEVKARLKARNQSLVLDTIIDRDTLSVSIEPDSTIQISLLPAPRLSQELVHFIRRDSIIYHREVVRVYIESPWFESPLLVIAGAVLGFLIAMLI